MKTTWTNNKHKKNNCVVHRSTIHMIFWIPENQDVCLYSFLYHHDADGFHFCFFFVFFCSWLHCLVQCVGYVCLSSFHHHHHWLFFIFFFHHHHHRFVLENLFVFSLALLLLIEHLFRLAVLFCFSYSIFGVCLFICFFFLFLDHNSVVYRYKDDHIIIIIVID